MKKVVLGALIVIVAAFLILWVISIPFACGDERDYRCYDECRATYGDKLLDWDWDGDDTKMNIRRCDCRTTEGSHIIFIPRN